MLLLYILIFTYALLIGSFLNVCIYRIPRKETVVTTPSHCTACGERIKWYDLIPVVSYILLRGKCRSCEQKVSIQYPMVELLNAVAYLWLFTIYGFSIQFIFMAIMASALIVIAMIDLQHMIIPDGILVFVFVVAILNTFLNPDIAILDAVIGFFTASVPLLILAVITNGGMGGGDIKLMAVAGIFLGWKKTLLSLFMGAWIGAIICVILIGLKIINRKDPIPFGVFLAIGIYGTMLYGEQILAWYIS